jgi:hypothetical protein
LRDRLDVALAKQQLELAKCGPWLFAARDRDGQAGGEARAKAPALLRSHRPRPFAELAPTERKAVAAELELRRAKIGTELLTAGEPADALYITLTGPVEIRSPARVEPES